MKKLIIIFLFVIAGLTSVGQTNTGKQYIPWLKSDAITITGAGGVENPGYFIWHGDTIDFKIFADSTIVFEADSTVLFVTLKQLSDSLNSLPGGHDPATIGTAGTTAGLSITGQSINMQSATAARNGYLTSADFSNFFNKLTTVAHDNTLSGLGTTAFPLSADTTTMAAKIWVLAQNYINENQLHWDSITNKPTIPRIEDIAYGATWDGDTDGASKNTIYDKIESLAGGHAAVTLGDTALTGGLKLYGQELEFQPATASLNGYLTSTDWQTFNAYKTDSAGILRWTDTLNTRKGIATPYDLTTGLATKEPTLTKGNLTENVTGLQFSATRQVIGGAAELQITSGYSIPTTAQLTRAGNHVTNDADTLLSNEKSYKFLVGTVTGNNINVTLPEYTVSNYDILTVLPDSDITGADSITLSVNSGTQNKIFELTSIDSDYAYNLVYYNSEWFFWLGRMAEESSVAGNNTGDQNIDTFRIASNTLELSLSGDGEPKKTVDLSPYLDDQTVTINNGLGINVSGTYPTFTAAVDTANASILSRQRAANTYQPKGSYLTAEVDGSTTNELQDLSLAGNTLSLSGDATTVDLSAYVNPSLANYISNTGTSTDNAIARFDGTTGKVIQNSNSTINDDGDAVFGGTVRMNQYGYIRSYNDDNGANHAILEIGSNRGTESSPAYLQQGDELGAVAFRGATLGFEGGSGMNSLATEDWYADSLGSKLTFFTTANKTKVKSTRFVIEENGRGYFGGNFGVGSFTRADYPLTITSDANGLAHLTSTNNLRLWSQLSSGSARFYLQNSSSVNSLINSNGSSYLMGGNLGINNSTPAYKLDVTGDVYTSERFLSGGDAWIGWRNKTASNNKTLHINSFDSTPILQFDRDSIAQAYLYENKTDSSLYLRSAKGDIKIYSGADLYVTGGFVKATTGVFTNLGNYKIPVHQDDTFGLIDSPVSVSGNNISVTGTITATGGNSENWNTAYSWGNHASAGYLTTEVDGSTTNEIQTLTYTPSTRLLDISGSATDATLPLFSTTTTDAGLVPGGADIAAKYLRGDGTWQTVTASDSQTLTKDSTATTVGVSISGGNRISFNKGVSTNTYTVLEGIVTDRNIDITLANFTPAVGNIITVIPDEAIITGDTITLSINSGEPVAILDYYTHDEDYALDLVYLTDYWGVLLGKGESSFIKGANTGDQDLTPYLKKNDEYSTYSSNGITLTNVNFDDLSDSTLVPKAWVLQQLSLNNENVQTLVGTSPYWNTLNGKNAIIALSGATTITMANLLPGQHGMLTVNNGGSTSYLITFAGYTFKIHDSIRNTTNKVNVSGGTTEDTFSWYYNGVSVTINGGLNFY